MKKLNKERQGEICYQLVVHRFKKSGLNLGNLRRELGNTASELKGVSVEDLMSLLSDMIPELLGDAFGYHHVGLTFSDPKKSS